MPQMAAAMPTLQRPTLMTEGELMTIEERVNSGTEATWWG
ncbi:hypothetical protein V6Z11_A01G208800 [Gossypium hirsutum]